MRRQLHLGFAATLLIVAGAGWGIGAMKLSGAVIAGATVVVESNVKRVQHDTGGVVERILVKNGDKVGVGDVLVHLDETSTRANLAIISRELDRLDIRISRLRSVIVGRDEIAMPERLEARSSDADVADILAGEHALLAAQNALLKAQSDQLRDRTFQYEQQIVGLRAQKAAADESLRIAEEDFQAIEHLIQQKLVPLERVSALKQRMASLRGETGRLTAAIAEVEGRIKEAGVLELQLMENARREANAEMREAELRRVELAEREVVARQMLARSAIRAPQDGFVEGLTVTTIGGVINPAEPIMSIVPVNDNLVVDARIVPADINDLSLDQQVRIRFPAFDVTTTPECHGSVERIGTDAISDRDLRISYYEVRIAVTDQESCLGDLRRLVPGMPAEVYIQTGDRTVWSYLVKPIADQLARSFRQ